MKRLLLPLLALTLTLICFFAGCQREVFYELNPSAGNPEDVIQVENQKLGAVITKQTQKSYVSGWVVNEQNQPVANATVECAGKTVTTNNKGYFYFREELTLNKDYALISVKKTGYMNGFKTFTPNAKSPANHAERIMLQTAGAPQWVTISGASIVLDNNIKLTFPSNAVVKQSGAAYTGSYKVVARYINPQSPNFPDMVPGLLTGLNNNGRLQALQSLGMATVELQDSAGNKLQLAPNIKVKMELPASPADPATVPLWHFNEKYGVWIQAGTATKTGNIYQADVNHFSIWNIDIEVNSAKLQLKFTDSNQTPLSGLRVWVYRQLNNIFVGSYFTDNYGEATLINCPSNESLTLKTIFECDTLFKTLAPVTQDRSETVQLPNGIQNVLYNVTGTLYGCNNQVLINQPFQVSINAVSGGATILGVSGPSAQFNISTLVNICGPAAATTAQTTSLVNNLVRYSAVSQITPGSNTYNPVVCDTITPLPSYPDSQVVVFSDINLEIKVRQAINKPTGTLYYIDVKNLAVLFAYTATISNLFGAQYCTGLQQLALEYNNITDISPLQNLVHLGSIDLSHNPLSNISYLQYMTSLISLGLDSCQVSDFSVLQNLPNLAFLHIESNNITNAGFLQTTPNLQQLYASNNQITNITPLQGLSSLTYLRLSENQIADVTPLQNLSALTTVDLRNNQISTIQPIINSLPGLTLLRITTGNNVPAQQIAAFQATHPNCLID